VQKRSPAGLLLELAMMALGIEANGVYG
jgi:hypothetical protein